MYKVSIKNELNGREYGAKFDSKEEKDAWVQEQIQKQSWGKNQRKVLRTDVPAELESRIIDLVNEVKFEIDSEGQEIEVVEEFAILKPDYVVTEKNLNLSKTYRNEMKLASRKSEYPSLEEILHVILDHGLDSQEYQELQNKRAEIKAKYPLES